MARKQQQVRWDDWVINAVESFRERAKFKDFYKTIGFLVRFALDEYGYYEKDYQPGLPERQKKQVENFPEKIAK